ncbi:TolB protein precursor periplasmic protein [Jejuia pallidilutea]|uniref:TolB protein periplasmic protein n=1 Tax=Jejuia pallidilutea TaxID=504487 RepID=A0A090VXN7_9FLAO|nr:TolB protein precursor periplasmic protein [Jejuia pallidilutea]
MKYFSLIICIVCLFNCKNEKKQTTKTINETVKAQDSLIYPGEKHFKSIRQVTFGGDNARLIGVLMINKLCFNLTTKNGM